MPGEFEFIRLFLGAFPRARVPLGPGDDCAVLAPTRGQLCVTTDALVEEVHFTRATFSPADIGHKALAVNLSDLAAMGASPRWFVCALALPRDFSAVELRGLAEGMARLARLHRIALVGGNFTSAREVSVTITAAGEVTRPALTRSGARPGHLLYVSGTLGQARLGLELLRAGRRSGAAVHRQRRPVPRVVLGRIASRYASAALDISDGLTQDLGHLCAASRVRADLELSRLPLTPTVRQRLGVAGAMAGGEDYELLLAVPPERCRAFERACARAGHVVTRIGAFSEGNGVHPRAAEGHSVPLPGGFDHFREPAGGLTLPDSKAKPGSSAPPRRK